MRFALGRTAIAATMLCCLTPAAHAGTILFTDNFSVANTSAATFNQDNASTQGGTLAPLNYTLKTATPDWIAQHSNAGNLLLASDNASPSVGSVSLNRNFATDANAAANQLLQVSFNIVSVSNYTDPLNWAQFNIGDAQNLQLSNVGVGLGLMFRQNGSGAIWSQGGALATFTYSPNDLATITLSNTAGTGSAFNGTGSLATVRVGASVFENIAIPQQSIGYTTFSAYNFDQKFGVGRFDNFSVALVVPEPSAAALMGIGVFSACLAVRSRKRPAARTSD